MLTYEEALQKVFETRMDYSSYLTIYKSSVCRTLSFIYNKDYKEICEDWRKLADKKNK